MNSAQSKEIGDRTTTRNLVAFFVLAFGWSWALWGPKALAAQSIIAGWPQLPNVAAFGPSIAGIVLLYGSSGRAGLRQLAKRTVDIGVQLRWLLVALLLFPALTGIVVIAAMTQGIKLTFPWEDNLVVLPIALVFILLLGGPIQEEFGWRGFALDPLQARFGATGGSVVLGVMWALWHLPLFFQPSQTIYYNKPFWGFVVSITLLTVIMTWVYNNTDGNLLLMLLLHTTFNWSQGMFPVLGTDFGSLLFLGLQGLVTITIILIWSPQTLVRSRYTS